MVDKSLVTKGGLEYWVKTHSAGAEREGRMPVAVGVSIPPWFEFSVRQETGLDGLTKGLGLASEVTTGDVVFDRRYFVTTTEPRLKRLLRADTGLRQRIEAVFGASGRVLELTGIVCAGGRLWVEGLQHVSRLPAAVSARVAEPVGDLAAHLRQHLTDDAASPSRAPRRRSPRGSRALFGGASLLAVATGILGIGYLCLLGLGLIRTSYVIDHWEVALVSLWIAVPAVLGFGYYGFRRLRQGMRPWTLLVAVAISAGGFAGIGYALTYLSNAALDAGPRQVRYYAPEEYSQRHVWRRRQGYRTVYEVGDWRPGREGERLEIRVNGRRPWSASGIAVTTRPGLLGIEWVASVEAQAEPAPKGGYHHCTL